MTGYSREEMIGQNPRLLSSSLHPPEVYTKMWKTILSRHSWQGELTNCRKDGSHFQASTTISPIEDAHHRLTHFVGIERDITEHKQVERQLLQAQKMQSVGTLAGGVAHEFNNLLAGINGYASLGLRETTLSAPVREFLQQVVTLSERAAQLTSQLLAFARKSALSRSRTQVSDLLHSTADLVRRTLHQAVVLEIETSLEIDLVVEADSNQMQQALVNLALNARDAIRERFAQDLHQGKGSPPVSAAGKTTAGRSGTRRRIVPLPQLAGLTGIDIVFRARHQVVVLDSPGFPHTIPPGDYVVVEVEDQGLGMTADVLTQSLDPFFTTKDVGQGTGLGLPMVFGIIQGHQGYLSIQSQPGVGTRIALYLPRLIESTDSDTVPELRLDPELVEPEILTPKTILVIDDEAAVRDVVRRFLEIAGHQCLSAPTSQDAIEQMGHQPVDLVILDLMMPREDASVVFHRLRHLCPGVPILLCTGLLHAEPAPELFKESRVGFIRKPFRMNELWYAVRKLLSGLDQEEGIREVPLGLPTMER
jgi:two-component system, cell cycle sensor histidine kinase and response regulator CckA